MIYTIAVSVLIVPTKSRALLFSQERSLVEDGMVSLRGQKIIALSMVVVLTVALVLCWHVWFAPSLASRVTPTSHSAHWVFPNFSRQHMMLPYVLPANSPFLSH